ncbi:hypothetical protein Mterra_03332 [Calidithermus terrae]|uniref:Uncharacterized protein n=1 Tax=Calidithermus terrae TaxID=1408545 RepID=A0A399ECG7_9DEIN|nr:hypothetical protein Mterra_03332 [Calidithermus terrae]
MDLDGLVGGLEGHLRGVGLGDGGGVGLGEPLVGEPGGLVALEQLVGRAAQGAGLHALQPHRQVAVAARLARLGAAAPAGELGAGELELEPLDLLLAGLELVLELAHPLGQPLGAHPQLAREGAQALELLPHVLHRADPGEGLDAPHARRHRLVGADDEGPDLAGAPHVAAAAQLLAAHALHAALDAHDPHHVGVLLAEEGHRAFLPGLLEALVGVGHGEVGLDPAVDQHLDAREVLGVDGLELAEVEAQAVGAHVAALLLHVGAQHRPQRGVEQVGGGVVLLGVAALRVHERAHRGARLEGALLHPRHVQEDAVAVLLRRAHPRPALGPLQHPRVADLAAALGVEGRLVEHHLHLGAGGGLLEGLVPRQQQLDLGLRFGLLVAHEDGAAVVLGEGGQGLVGLPEQVALEGHVAPGELLRLLQRALVAPGVHPDAAFVGDLEGEVEGEAVGVVEGEGVLAGEGVARLQPREHAVQALDARLEGFEEALLLEPDLPLHAGEVLAGLGVDPAHHLGHHPGQPVHERLAQAQQVAVAHRAAQQPPHHVAAPGVGEVGPVREDEGHGAGVLGDDPVGQRGGPLVADAAQLDDPPDQGDELVGLVEVGDALQHHRHPRQAHAGVDVGLGQGLEHPPVLAVVLREHQVPDLHEAVALAGLVVVGPGVAAEPGAAVVVDLRARPAGAVGAFGGGVLRPEVLVGAEAVQAALGQAHALGPVLEGLVVVLVDGDVDAVGLKAQPLGAGEELPGPLDGLLLEVVAEGEVAQHLEDGLVAVGAPHVLDVAGAHRLLAGGHAVPLALVPREHRLLAHEVGLERGHPGVDEQEGGVVVGDHAEGGQPQVPLALEEGEELLADLGGAGPAGWFSGAGHVRFLSPRA